tara:strand:- start:647 stop:1687 length:1041 start_codon:yes stop_codon:yes gene_type:complete
MALRTSLILSILLSSVAWAKLPILATKQDVTNIRYLTRDGKYTYYQRRSGDLLLGTNYNVSEVLKSDMGTHYTIASVPQSQWIVINQIKHMHRSYDPRLVGNIFRNKKGQTSTTELGSGTNPEIHLNGSWVSFYEPYTRLIIFKSLDNPQIGFNIQTASKLNPYFFPTVVMSDEQTALYVDMNEKGESALIRFNRIDGKSKVLYKNEGVSRRLEVCHTNGKSYLGAFPYQQADAASEIWELDQDKGPTKPIYSSSMPDIGHMVCDHTEGKIYFSKAFKQGKAYRHDIYALDITSGESESISDFRYATQLINMDGLLLIPFQGKYYVPLEQKQAEVKDTLGPKGEAL